MDVNKVLEITNRIDTLKEEKYDYIKGQHYEKAANARDEERELLRELHKLDKVNPYLLSDTWAKDCLFGREEEIDLFQLEEEIKKEAERRLTDQLKEQIREGWKGVDNETE